MSFTPATPQATPKATPMSAGGHKMNVIGGVALAVVLGVGGMIFRSKFKKPKKGMLSYSAMNLTADKIDADKMIPAVEATAREWRSDAAFWSINLQAVHADGTLDATSGGAQIEYVSLSGVTSELKKTRDDSIKKFSFGPSGADHSAIWGATNKWKITATPSLPHCGIKNVVKQLVSKGLTGDKTVRVTFDPQFADSLAWHVLGEDPKIDAYFSMEDCSPLAKN